MSFTTEIKQELAYNDLKECCMKAQLSALIQLTSSLSIKDGKLNLVVRSENPTTSKRVIALLKKLYKSKTELLVVKKANLKQNNVYTVLIHDDAKKILEDLGLYGEKGLLNHPSYTIVSKDCCLRAYLAGAFLAYGTCNSPNKKNYHLEIALSDIEHANFIVKLLSKINLDGKITKRRNKYVVYIKKAESITDFLKHIRAHECVMNFENIRIERDFKNNLVRVGNCEIANEIKSQAASKRQVDIIKKLKKSIQYKDLDKKLKDVCELRLKYQDYTLMELCKEYENTYGESISKSGMKHRLNKIENIKA